LEALERDDYTALPAEVTVKGFLRSYVRCLGLNEQDVMARYQQFAAEYFQIAHEADPVKGVVEPARHHVWQHRLTVAGLAAAGVMVVISVIALWNPRGRPEHPTAISSPLTSPPSMMVVPHTDEPTPDQPADAAPPAPTGTVGIPITSVPASLPTPKPSDAMTVQRLVITASEPSWVQAFIDDTEWKEALMQPGERLDWSARKYVRLTVGNAGGVSIQFNGEAVPSLGASGQVRTLVLPRGAVTASVPVPAESSGTNHGSTALTSPNDSNTVPIQPL
jgi:cytoskeleton protein RodZ